MATTRDYNQAGTTGGRRFSAEALNRSGVIANILDTADDNQGAADIAEMLAMDAGWLALIVGMQVLTLEGGTMTVDVGVTAVGADDFLDGTNLNTGTVPVYYASNVAYTDATDAGNVESAIATQLYSVPGGLLFTAADTIDVLWNNAADLAKIRLSVFVIDTVGNGLTERPL